MPTSVSLISALRRRDAAAKRATVLLAQEHTIAAKRRAQEAVRDAMDIAAAAFRGLRPDAAATTPTGPQSFEASRPQEWIDAFTALLHIELGNGTPEREALLKSLDPVDLAEVLQKYTSRQQKALQNFGR